MVDLNRKWILFTLTWPIFIETGMRLLMGNVSVFMIGQYSDSAVAAVGVSTQIINMLVMIYGIVATGTAIIINQHLGAGDKKTASQAVVVSICANFLFGLVMSALTVAVSGEVARFMNLHGSTRVDAALFLTIVGGTSFFQAVVATVGAVFRSYGLTKYPMLVALLMNAVNIAGNYLALFRPFGLLDYGVRGVAISMAASALAGMAAIVWLFCRNFDWKSLIRMAKPFPNQMLRKILLIGIPAATESVSYNISQIVITFFVTYMGTEVLATRILAYNITTFVYILGLAIGQGTQILVGHMIGAGRADEAYRMVFGHLKFAMIANIALSLLLVLFREPVFGLYTDNADIIRLGVTVLLIDIFVETGRALNHIGNGSLRGAGDVRYPMVVNVISMWGVGVLFCYLFGIGLHWGLVGVWLALGADEWLRGLAVMLRWRSRIWTRMSVVKREVGERSV